MPLPLLRIPDVALKYIANHMSNVELVKISLYSRKADRALKRCGQRELSYFKIDKSSLNHLEHLELSLLEAGRAERGVCTTHRLKLIVHIFDSVKVFVHFDGCTFYFHVMCLNKLNQFSGIQKSLMMKDTYIPVVMTRNGEMYTFWNNRADGLIFLLKCLNERFRYITHELTVQDKVMPDVFGSLKKYVDYSSLPEVSFSCVFIGSRVQMPTNEFKYILENVKLKDQLDSRCEFLCSFKPDEGFKLNSTILCSKIIIAWGHWITLEYLLKCKHKEIKLTFSKFTNEEMKTYINRWVAGTIPDVQQVYIELTESFELKFVLSGLQRCRMSECLREGDNILDNRCVFIKGAGEKIARVEKCRFYKGKEFNMKVYSDPSAVDIEEEDEESDVSESIDEDEEEDEEEYEDEEEEESDGDANMEEDEEENDSD